jgi:hypothetical protein
MKKQHRLPFIGVLLSGALCFLLIHFWLADFYASQMEVSHDIAYYSLVSLLVPLIGWRAWRAARGKDEIANWIEERFKN